MKKILFLAFLLTALPACLIQPKPSALVFDDSTAADNYRAIASVDANALDYTVTPYVTDRVYVESKLNQIFGSAGDAATNAGVFQKREFGGPCDRYALGDKNSANAEYPRAQCFNGIGTVQPANSNPMRYSFTAKSCEGLVNTTARFNTAMMKVFPSWATTASTSKPDAASITKAYQLFFPIDPPSDELISTFMSMAAAASNNQEGWKQILVTLCESPEWQVF